MQLIFDNIIASMIGGVVLLILVTTHHRNQLAAAEASGYYMLQQQVMDFTGTIQRDLQNMSAAVDVVEVDDEFQFMAQVDAADTTKKLVTYRRESRGQLEDSDGNLVDVYQIVRLVNGSVAGGSISSISEWSVEGLNLDESAVADPADVAAVRIAMHVLPPVLVEPTDGLAMRGTRWQATFRPRLLRLEEL